MQAFIKTHSTRNNGSKDSFLTVSADVKESPMTHHKRGLQYTASGYGSRIPTVYMVRFNGKWRRVYCAIFSNVGSLYIGPANNKFLVDIDA